MKRYILTIFGTIVLFVPTALLSAEDTAGRAFAQFNGGIWSASSGSQQLHEGRLITTVDLAFYMSSTVGYGLTGETSAILSLGLIAAKVDVKESGSRTPSQSEFVVPILIGISYYSHVHALDSTLHPFFSLSMGPVAGIVSRNDVESHITRSEVVFGGRFGAGIEKQFWENYYLSLNVGLSLMSNFAGTIAGRRNFNGADVSLGFGILLGTGGEE